MDIPRTALGCTVSWMFLTVTVGCGQSNRAAVSGQVSFDGKAVEDGAISFVPTGDNPGLPAWGKIQAGRYSIPSQHADRHSGPTGSRFVGLVRPEDSGPPAGRCHLRKNSRRPFPPDITAIRSLRRRSSAATTSSTLRSHSR